MLHEQVDSPSSLRARFHHRVSMWLCGIVFGVFLLLLWTSPAPAHHQPTAVDHACVYFDDTPATGCAAFMGRWSVYEGCDTYRGNNPLCMKIDGRILRFRTAEAGGRLLACQIDAAVDERCGHRSYQYPVIAAHLSGRVVAYGDLVAELERWCTSCDGNPASYIYRLARHATRWQNPTL